MAVKLNKLGVKNSLWNNIRANKGSGKAPTKEMLKQERKINAKYKEGGTIGKYPEGGDVFSNPELANALPDNSPVRIGNEDLYKNYKPVVSPYTYQEPAANIPSAKEKKEIKKAIKKEEAAIENMSPVKKAMITNPAKAQTFQPLAADAQAMYEEKKKNPNWKNFKGNYSIYSKENSMLNLFDNKHNLLDQTRAGRGVGKGDNPNLANPENWYDSNKNKKGQENAIKNATTPAGAYAIKENPMNYNNYGTKTYSFGDVNKYNAQTAMHGIYKGDSYNRTKIINDPNIKQAFVSNGCLNIPAPFLNKNDSRINTGDSLFVTKEPKFANGGRVLPRFGKGGNWAGTDAKGNAIQTTFGKSTAGQNVVTGAGIAAAAVPMLTSFIPDEQVTDSEGNVLGAKENMGKGVLNSAAQGASMGMAAGPWGAAIGAGLGAIYGGVTNSMANADLDRAKQQANMRIQSKNLSNKLLTNQNNYSINSYNNDQMIAANGGTVVNQDMGNPNAELELQETFRDPMTGETGMVDGPSHDNGGIEMNLAEGTQIWSDRLKHNGRTFASLTKPIINQIANLEKGTDSNPNSRFKQNTIKLLNSQLDFFFDKQEAGKQQDEMKRTLKKQNGGVVEDMGNYHYGDGGIHIKPENKGKFTAWANAHDMGVQEAARHVMANKEDYSSTIVKRANFAKNAAGWKHAMGGYVLPKYYLGGEGGEDEDNMPNTANIYKRPTSNVNGIKISNNPYDKRQFMLDQLNPNMTQYKTFDPAVSAYKANQNADLAAVNNNLGAQMNQMNISSNRGIPNTMGPMNRPAGYQEPVRPMQTVPTMPMGYDNNAMLKRSIKPYYNNADNNYNAAVPIEAQAQETWKGTMPTDMNTLRRGASDYENTFNDMRGAQSAYENRFRNAQGEYEDLVKLRKAQGEYQNQPVAATQPENRSQWYRNNNGQLIQAGALAGSTFGQLANINRQTAPGINPNVRLTGAIPTPRFMDLSGQRGAINRAAFGAMEGAQRGFGSSASAQAFKNKARLDQLQGLGQSYLAQENANADIYNKFAGMQGDAAMREAIMNSEIGRGNIENRFNFDQSKMRAQNAALATLGHGVGDIGRNITNYGNEMDRVNILASQYEPSVIGSIYKNNPKLLEEAWNKKQISENTYNKYKNPVQAKYGGTIKKRSLKY